MIDWQMSSAGPDWKAAREEIQTAFEDAGLIVYGREQPSGPRTEDFMGVAVNQILSRRTGGGGGDPNVALYVIARFWPYVVSGGAAAIGADVWKATKKALRVALERLLLGRTGSVSIQTVKDDDHQRDITFRFFEGDLSDIDLAVDKFALIVEQEVANSALGLDPGAWFEWDPAKRRWEVTRTWREVPRR